jgi:hypothetical protein
VKKIVLFAGLIVAFSSWSAHAQNLDPVPGSITYKGQPRTKLTKSPIGSTFPHYFTYRGDDYAETYRIRPDRSLEIISRYRTDRFNFSGNR